MNIESRLLHAMKIFPRHRMWLSLAGIMVCAILFFGVLSVVHWLSYSSTSYFGEQEGIYVLAQEEAATVKQSQVPLALAPALTRMNGIQVVCPELFIYGVLNDKAVIIRGIFPSDFQSLEPVTLIQGRWLRDDDIKAAVAGQNLARKLDLKVNDTYLLSGSEVDDFVRIRIVGIFKGGGMIDDDLLMNIHYARYLQQETQPGYASIIRAKVNTTIWPSVESIWQSVSGLPNITPLQYEPTAPNNTQRLHFTCNATAHTEVGSVILYYKKQGLHRTIQKTMIKGNSSQFRTQIGPVKDSSWVLCWANATDILGHDRRTPEVNISITDALGPDIFDLTIEPPPPQTKDHLVNVSFKVFDTSEMVRNVTVHTYNVGLNRTFHGKDSTGRAYELTLGRFEPGPLTLWISARDRFGNLARTARYRYRILNRTDQSPPEIGEMVFEPDPPNDNSTLTVNVPMFDDSEIVTADLIYDYQVKGIHYNGTLKMNRSQAQEGLWEAVTGSFPGATTIHFRIFARDQFGNAVYSETRDVFVRYSEPPEELQVYRFPQYSTPGLNNLVFAVLYDAAEIQEVNFTFVEAGRWTNLSIPVGITTFREPFLLGRLSTGFKEYNLSMEDRREEVTRYPGQGLEGFLVQRKRPHIEDIQYSSTVRKGFPLMVTFRAVGVFPLSEVYTTDSRGVVEKCERIEGEYTAILGPYSKPGDYSFSITTQDWAGNTRTIEDREFTVEEESITDIDFTPKPPILGEELTVTCRVIGDSPRKKVRLIAPVGGKYVLTPMELEEGRRFASIPIDSPGILPFSVQVEDGEDLIRSKTVRLNVGSNHSSLYLAHSPPHPLSTQNITISIFARSGHNLKSLELEWKNGSHEIPHRKVWRLEGTETRLDFKPGRQIEGTLLYRAILTTEMGSLTYPLTEDEWLGISITKNLFTPPEIGRLSLSPQTYVGLDGNRGQDFLVEVGCPISFDQGISSVEIDYVVDQRTYNEPLLPVSRKYGLSSRFYSAYLGPFPTNETISCQVTARSISGLESSTPEVSYVLRDTEPPEIQDIYHDPLHPEPKKEITIGCEVTDDSGVKDVLLLYGGNGTQNAERMMRYGNTYTLDLLSPPAGESLTYAIQATDNYGNSNQSLPGTVTSRDETPPDIWEVTHDPLEPTDNDSVNITVRLIDRQDEIENVTLLWYQYTWKNQTKKGGSGYITRVFQIDASEFDPGMNVRYKIEAFDRSGNKAVYPNVEQGETPPSPLLYGDNPNSLRQEAWEPYLTFRVVDRSPPVLTLDAQPESPNELETVTFEVSAEDNHLLRNYTLHLWVSGVYRPFSEQVGRPSFRDEFSSGPLEPASTIVCYLEAYDRSGNYARFPARSNLTIDVERFEWGGEMAAVDPRVDLEVAGPAGFSQGMARQGAGKIIASINGILFMTFLATVAGIGNIVYTSVFKSKREIGLVRTLGGSKKFVTLLVASVTVLLGLTAALIGCVIAYLLITVFSNLGASLAWVTLKPTFNILILAATSAAAVTISLFGGMVALTRLFSYTPVESIRTVTAPQAKREHPTYIENTRRFPAKTIAVLLLITISAAAMMRLYPTYISEQPFDPDSWLHLTAASDMRETGHLRLDYASREMQAVSALPGLNILLVVSQVLTGSEMIPARIITPIISSLGLILAFVLARKLSRSDIVAGMTAIILAVVGFYANRTAALTKEALALQMLLLCLYMLYLSHISRSTKHKTLLVAISVALMLTHHLTAIYFMLIFVGYIFLRIFHKYSQGVIDPLEVKQDALTGLGVLTSYLIISFTLGKYETPIPFQDSLLIISLFFVTIGFGRILLSSSFLGQHRRSISLVAALGTVTFPFIAYRAGLFSYAPWEQVLPMIAPHLSLLAIAILALFPVSLLSENRKSFILAWASAVIPFLLFGLVKRDIFGYILLFRNISYGYQLSAILVGIAFVYAYKRFEAGGQDGIRTGLVAIAAVLLMTNLLFASHMGFLSRPYEKKDLYTTTEFNAALKVNQSTLRGQLVGSDERGRRLLLYVTGEDGDQITTYVYMIRMEKWLINRLNEQVNLTEKPLTHILTYDEMFEVGFVDQVLFKDVERLELNRYEDVILDNGGEHLIYVARKEWP